jgi:hypothetical protein
MGINGSLLPNKLEIHIKPLGNRTVEVPDSKKDKPQKNRHE